VAMWSDDSDADTDDMLPAVLRRPTVANHIVQERVTMDTLDFEDHHLLWSHFRRDVHERATDSVP